MKATSAHMAEIGRRGGLATFHRYGRDHMSAIGRKGFRVMVAKYWGGDRARAVRRLVELGRMAQDPAPWNYAWQHPKRGDEPW